MMKQTELLKLMQWLPLDVLKLPLLYVVAMRLMWLPPGLLTMMLIVMVVLLKTFDPCLDPQKVPHPDLLNVPFSFAVNTLMIVVMTAALWWMMGS